MAIIRRQPEKRADDQRTILHSDHGAQADSTGGFQPVEQGGGQRAAGDAGGGAGTQSGQLEQRATRVCRGCLVRG